MGYKDPERAREYARNYYIANKEQVDYRYRQLYHPGSDKVLNKRVKNNLRNNNMKSAMVELAGNFCRDCYGTFPLPVFHFHHLNPKDKLFSLNNTGISGKTWDQITVEVRKCVLLCANCHIIRHYHERCNN